MFKDQEPNKIENWTCVYQTGTEYDAEMVKNYFADQEIDSQILSKRDRAYNMNIGQMSMVYVYVPNDQVKNAEKALDDWKNGIIEIGTSDFDPDETDDKE
ncbi:MAG: DUF2007 domain-containing protein [Balneolales bacterium]|nr:DUF2007 domain-containing protein [Balneolales bacterium]